MIDKAEVTLFTQRFGAPAEQIRRDHLISHVLAALGAVVADEPDSLTFFGGTALCRTWLPNLRFSEDIDLLVDTLEYGEALRNSVSRTLRNEFPDVMWVKVGLLHDVETWNLSSDAMTVKVQFALWRQGWEEAIPTTMAPVDLRYSDLPDSTTLSVPTASGFVAMKLIAWLDRSAPRDIYDLGALAESGAVDDASLEAVLMVIGHKPNARMITNVPMRAVRADWDAELVHQIENPKSLDDCIDLVRQALEATTS